MRQVKDDVVKEFRICVREIERFEFLELVNACPDFYMFAYQQRVFLLDLNETDGLSLSGDTWRVIHKAQDEGFDYMIGVQKHETNKWVLGTEGLKRAENIVVQLAKERRGGE